LVSLVMSPLLKRFGSDLNLLCGFNFGEKRHGGLLVSGVHSGGPPMLVGLCMDHNA
jgi:hypothetical protein